MSKPNNPECRMNGCDLAGKCCFPENCGENGFITLGKPRIDILEIIEDQNTISKENSK